VPRSIDRILEQTALPDTITDDELDDLQQEIIRDVTATLMFGPRPAPATHLQTADRHLQELSVDLLRSSHAAEHLARIADDPIDIDGALHFACLLNLTRKPEGARWWWQYAAGAGNATAAYCLHLFHLGRGELRDADHWMGQARDLDIDLAHRPARPERPRTPHTRLLREAVERLKVDEACGEFHHPDQRLADHIDVLADAR
jgi:hypothetical protein